MATPESLAPANSKTQVFLRRLASTIVLWAGILTVMFSGKRYIADGMFALIIAFLAMAGLVEFYGLARKRGLPCFKVSGVIGGMLLMCGTFAHLEGWLGIFNSPARVNDFETSFLILFVLGLCLRQLMARDSTSGISAIAVTLLGLMYVPWLLNFIQKINFFPGVEGKYFLLYFILLTKFSDMGAYAVGSLIGRHKMIPRISPGKTWEGFMGAVVVSTGASLLFVQFFGAHMAGMNNTQAILLGIILSSAAVVGDLIESQFKRECGAKDSGQVLPGIGGILDLVDSLLFNAPIMYLYLRHVLVP
jgi:phosphatidate cytidylyltransferase